jgi:small acid-soluble spore protein N (minor)
MMGNQKKHPEPYAPSHLGTQPRGFSGNNGKKMNDTSGKHAQVIQTKGE